MKYIKRLLLLLILLIPGTVFAASGSLSVSSASTGVVGNNLNVSVTLSSSTGIGSWEFDISYDSSYLKLTSSTAESGGTHVVNYSGSGGIKSKTYNFTFKVLKSGSTTIRVSSSDVYAYSDESRMSISNGSRTVSLKTQAEIEASYSANAYLKSLSVGDYTLDPEFNKETKEYNVEVENDVEKVTINASKEDANASVSGTGEKELQEGINKFEIVVTAQKGNSLTYVVNVTRKELNPIKVSINNKDYTIARKKELLPELLGFVEDTTTYEDTEIPSLYNETLNFMVIGVRDDENNVYTYLYDEGSKTIKSRYIQLMSGEIVIYPISYEESIKGYEQKEFDIDGYKMTGLAISDKQVIIKGINLLSKEEGLYLYDIDNKIFIPFDITNIEKQSKDSNTYKLIIIILAVVVILLIGLNLFKKGNKKVVKKENKPVIDEFKEIEVEDEKEIIDDEVIGLTSEINVEEIQKEEKKEKKKEKKKAKSEKKRLKELEKQERLEEQEEVKEPVEEVKEEKVIDDDDIDDPLNDEDDFMDFWETTKIKKIK